MNHKKREKKELGERENKALNESQNIPNLRHSIFLYL